MREARHSASAVAAACFSASFAGRSFKPASDAAAWTQTRAIVVACRLHEGSGSFFRGHALQGFGSCSAHQGRGILDGL